MRFIAWIICASSVSGLAQNAYAAVDPDAVVKLVHLSVADLVAGDRAGAASSLDTALAVVESTHGAGPEAEKARSLWYAEGSKIFKGEPYERCMMYYYRGLLYTWSGDYGNAHACFSNGILQDSFAEESQYRSDFGLLYFLSVYSAALGHTDAQDDERDLARLRPDAPKLAAGLVPLLCETGKAPRKLADGVGHYELKLRRGKNFRTVGARAVYPDGTIVPAYPMEDIAFQAMTRGGRPVDAILRNKVQFRETADAIGSTLSGAASTAMLSSTLFTGSTGSLQTVGAVGGAVGAIIEYAAAQAQPHADVRAWDNLPDTVELVLVPESVVRSGFSVDFLDKDGGVVASQQMGGAASAGTKLLWCHNSE